MKGPVVKGPVLQRTAGGPRGLAGWPGRAAIGCARLYQRSISPLLPHLCRFEPSCSRYFVEAVERHGLARGGLLGLRRLLRCQPLCRGGFDPVP